MNIKLPPQLLFAVLSAYEYWNNESEIVGDVVELLGGNTYIEVDVRSSSQATCSVLSCESCPAGREGEGGFVEFDLYINGDVVNAELIAPWAHSLISEIIYNTIYG